MRIANFVNDRVAQKEENGHFFDMSYKEHSWRISLKSAVPRHLESLIEYFRDDRRWI